MVVKTYTLGPGSLTLGAAGTLLTASAQVRSFTVKASENVTTKDPVPVLSGETIAGSESVTHSWTVEGTFLQDLAAAGVIDWSWANRGTEQALTFIPNTAAGRKVTCTIIPVPLDLGGDLPATTTTAATEPSSDFTWRVKTGTTPVLAAAP